jgi:GAF domain-containing protein
MNNLFTDPTVAPIRGELLQGGYRSCAAFPLFVQGNVVAALILLADEYDFFDAEEIALLDTLAADLSFALEYIEKSQRLDYLISYDTLTGLPNVRLFSDRLEQFINLSPGTQVGMRDRGRSGTLHADQRHARPRRRR